MKRGATLELQLQVPNLNKEFRLCSVPSSTIEVGGTNSSDDENIAQNLVEQSETGRFHHRVQDLVNGSPLAK